MKEQILTPSQWYEKLKPSEIVSLTCWLQGKNITSSMNFEDKVNLLYKNFGHLLK